MARRLEVALALLTVLLASGCFSVSGRFGSPIPREQVLEIRDGTTTRAQIMTWFGPPSAFYKPSLLDLILANGEQVEAPSAPLVEDVYSYRAIETNVRILLVPLFALRARAATQTRSLVVFFDENGIVRSHGFRQDGSDDAVGAAEGE